MELDRDLFLPVSREDMARRGWDFYDFLLITGDAYVDHPSFGPAIIGRVLEAEGYRVVAGINGDFYNVNTGLPIGLVVTGGGRRPSPPWDAPGWGC